MADTVVGSKEAQTHIDMDFTDSVKRILKNFIDDGPKSFTKLYSAKKHGCDAAEFHKRCDNRGPTVTMVYNVAGEVYGGYTSISWQSVTATPVYDNKAFLFILKNHEDTDTRKFPVKTPTSAILWDEQSGPTFGSGPDLQVFNGTIKAEDNGTFLLNASMYPSSYQDMPDSLDGLLSGVSGATDIVVYGIDDVTQDIMDEPWRSDQALEKQYLSKLVEDVEQYWPLKGMGASEDALQHVNILFIGPIGAGKSSFLNSVESVFRGYVTMAALAGNRTKSFTTAYKQYAITGSDNKRYLRFQLCDCRGLEDGMDITKDVDTILDGHVPTNYTFNIDMPLTSKNQLYVKEPKLKDKIHCVVYVLDAEKNINKFDVSFLTEGVMKQIKDIQEICDQKGIPQLVLLNKVDMACPAAKLDTSVVYRSTKIRQKTLDAADCLGMPPNMVLPMKNHYMEVSTTTDISILAMYNIRQMLRAADSYLRVNHLDELRADKYESPANAR